MKKNGMTSPDSQHDIEMMRLACAAGRRRMGASSPNPAVGAVACAANGEVLAVDAHRKAGQPHGEINVLNICRDQHTLSRVDTLYVTLEPCNHHGRTPPCSEAIIAAQIRRVVIGARDPNPQVAGGGVEKLRQAGIEIATGIEEQPCIQSMHAFFHQAQTGKPWITIKRAFDVNGSMIPPPGRKTFTAPDSLRLAHALRKKSDAIVTGSGTVLADNPLFTVRHLPDHAGKRRWLAIIDRRGRVPDGYLYAAAARGFDAGIYRDIDQAVADLTRKGAQDILVEAGPALSHSVRERGLWTMAVDIRQADTDRENFAFNPAVHIPFDAAKFDKQWFLPDQD